MLILFDFFFKWIDPVLMFHSFLQSICIFPFMFFKTLFSLPLLDRMGNSAFLEEQFIYSFLI